MRILLWIAGICCQVLPKYCLGAFKAQPVYWNWCQFQKHLSAAFAEQFDLHCCHCNPINSMHTIRCIQFETHICRCVSQSREISLYRKTCFFIWTTWECESRMGYRMEWILSVYIWKQCLFYQIFGRSQKYFVEVEKMVEVPFRRKDKYLFSPLAPYLSPPHIC